MFEEKQDQVIEAGSDIQAAHSSDAKQAQSEKPVELRRRPSRRDAWFSTTVDLSKARKPAALR